jgi:hypothetical protein
VCSNSDSVIDEYESSQENVNGGGGAAGAALAKKKDAQAPISSSNSSKILFFLFTLYIPSHRDLSKSARSQIDLLESNEQ